MNNIKILDYSIIYHLEDAVKALASELLAPIRKEEHIGTALVKQIFSMTKGGKIAGCTVTKGKVQKGSLAKVIRGESTVYTGSIENLRHLKDEVKEVISGRDCGIKLAGFEEISKKSGFLLKGFLSEVLGSEVVERFLGISKFSCFSFGSSASFEDSIES